MPSSSREYPHLSARTLSIPASRVRKTWKALPTNTQDRIKTLLLAIQSESLASLQEEGPARKKQRRGNATWKLPATTPDDDDYTTATTKLIATLTKAVPKMTFPPSSARASKATSAQQQPSDIDFSLEATLNRTQTLQHQVAQATQSAKLLRMQIRREEADLKRDRAELSTLETNSRAAETEGRRLEREGRVHPLARDVDKVEMKAEDSEEREGIHEQVNKARSRTKAVNDGTELLPGSEEVEADADLQNLTKGLRSHLTSMRTNTQSLSGVRRELRRAQREVALWGLKEGVTV
jgi:kinetochore protein Fta7